MEFPSIPPAGNEEANDTELAALEDFGLSFKYALVSRFEAAVS
jgi:hypothetical protein